MSEGRRLFIGVDIGGTFTDLVLAAEPGGEVRNVKVLTTSEPSQAVLAAVEEVLGGAGAEPSDVRRFVNATTLATNLVLERKGSRTAYLATEGFGDAFRLGKHRPVGSERFDLLYGKPPPLVPPELVVEVRERIDAAGRVLRPLDLEDLARKLDALAEQKPSSVAICLLHAYAHPQHEERVAALVRERLPDVYVAVSSEVWPEYQEYERASTTVVSGYVGPTMAEYVGRLDEGLRQLGIVARLEIMQSSGAVMPAAVAAHKAVYSVESGPAAGAILAADVGARGGWSNVLSFDMGGTTAKAGLIRDGKPAITHGFRVGGTLSAGENTSGEPIRIPVVDLAEVGAGGGSIAWVDDGGFLKVGPRSAGSDPGPACYGRGGEVPTVTDANVILGYLDPDYFLGGRMAIDAGLSRGAIERHVATPLGGDVVTAAWGIHELANLRMAAAVRMVTVQRGIDPREFAVVAFGGAGPAHIVRVAEQFDITTIIVPPSPGVASAFGLLRTDLAYDYVSTRLMPCDGMSADLLRLAFDELEEQGRADLAGDDVAAADIVVTRTVDVRFAHQRQLLTLALTGPLDHEVMDRIDRAFRRAYRTSYGVSPPDPCVVVNLGLRVVGRVPKPQGPRSTGRTDGGRGARKGSRGVCFAADGDLVETAIYDRMALEPGAEAIGPALFEEPDSTTVCPPGRRARVDDLHNLVIT